METSTVLYAGVGVAVAMLVFRSFQAKRAHVSSEDMKQLLEKGAVILDVRTKQEFSQGHAPGSRNIPLDRLGQDLKKLDRKKPILVCCASGARSAAGKALLEKAGFTNVSDAGPWQRLVQA